MGWLMTALEQLDPADRSQALRLMLLRCGWQ